MMYNGQPAARTSVVDGFDQIMWITNFRKF